MELLIAYDVATDSAGGRRRLRHVAQECQNFGQRVQKSVFECTVNAMQREELLARLLKWINKSEDSLRIYRLSEPKEKCLRVYGLDHYVDFEGPLIT